MLATRFAALAAVFSLVLPLVSYGQATNNPINGSAPIAHWSFVLEDVVTIPSGRAEFLTHNPANGQAYVVNQLGSIYEFDPTAANPTASTYVNLTAEVGSLFGGGEAGVRGLAFHPDVDNEGTAGYRKMYTSLSRSLSSTAVGNPKIFGSPESNPSHYSVVGEWTLNADYSVDTSSYRELLRIEQPYGNHNSGDIGFDPTAASGGDDYGNLYITVGDGGSGGGPFDLSQDIDTTPAPYPHGKILRIDPVASGGDPYSIPTDNPFAGQANRVEETWAYGLRNPHKIGWDPLTGAMYISDIGQGTIEEISVGHLGANYGWNDREGSFVYTGNVSPLPADHATDQYTYPVAQYDHQGSNGISGSSAIVGGTVYRGDDVPELTGMYLFSDFATNPGPIFAVDADDLVERDDFTDVTSLSGGRLSPYVEVEIRDGVTDKDFRQFLRDANNNQGINRTDTRWGVGPDGEIYLLSKQDRTIRRIAGIVGLTPGDADRDNSVNGDDLARWLAAFGESGDWSDGNFDASALVDGEDFLTWQRNAGGVGGIASVPEPSALLLAAMAAMLAINTRRPVIESSLAQ